MRQIILLLFILLLSVSNFGQQLNSIDSLQHDFQAERDLLKKIELAKKLSKSLKNRDSATAFAYLYKGLKMSRQINNTAEEAEIYGTLGALHAHYNQTDSLRNYYQKALKMYKQLEDNKGLAKVYKFWSRAENLLGNFKYALELSQKSIDYAIKGRNGILLSDCFQQKATVYIDKADYQRAFKNLINASKALDTVSEEQPLKQAIIDVGIGRVETLRNNMDEAIPYLKNGILILESIHHENWLVIAYMELGNTFYDLKDYDNALIEYKKGLSISERNEWNNFIAPYLSNLGAIYLEKEDYQKALDNFFRAKTISKNYGSINNEIIYFNDVASAYFGLKDYKKALYYYNQALQLADSIGSIDNLADAYLERSQTYEALNNANMALSDLKNHKIYKDSIFNIEKSKQIETLKIQYETEKKEQQITLQQNEIELLNQQKRNNNLYRLLLFFGLALCLFVIYSVYQKLKRRELEKEKLDVELRFKKKELTTYALHLAKKNEFLDSLKTKAQSLKHSNYGQNGYQQLINTIEFDIKDDTNWESFSKHFHEIHKDFNQKVKKKYPDLTPNELRLMALLKMNLTSKEVANILNISPDGIKKARYRLRKKLHISTEDSLQEFIIKL